MTAEIAILNKTAVALAADSAVTFGSPPKIYDSVNKLFRLYKHHPVAVMIYGNPDFMGIPWESIIKMYRGQHDTSGRTIRESAEAFMKYVCNEKFCTEAQQKSNIRGIFTSLFDEISGQIINELTDIMEKKKHYSSRDVNQVTRKILDRKIRELNQTEKLPSVADISEQGLIKKYQTEVDDAKSDSFGNITLINAAKSKLRQCARLAVTRDYFSYQSSGVVIAGFGADEIFPSLIHLEVDGVIGENLKIAERSYRDIGRESSRAVIVPFAQTEMVGRFMEGVDFSYQNYVERYMSRLMYNYGAEIIDMHAECEGDEKKEILRGLRKTIKENMEKFQIDSQKMRRSKFVDPILDVLVHLPKQELANMAEALVNLTSVKRRVSAEMETVGGPIDVAVVSKGDGFVWIKRKQYFRPEVNPQFLIARVERQENGGRT